MSGFLAGFRVGPKPLKGVKTYSAKRSLVSELSLKEILVSVTSTRGLTSWLGLSGDFFPDLGSKFQIEIDGQVSEAVITGMDLPKKFVFIIESVGEFIFKIKAKGNLVELELEVRRALVPSDFDSWAASLDLIFNRLELKLKNA